jgi:hypothetical protein
MGDNKANPTKNLPHANAVLFCHFQSIWIFVIKVEKGDILRFCIFCLTDRPMPRAQFVQTPLANAQGMH